MKAEKITQIISQIKTGKEYYFWKGRKNGNYIDEYSEYRITLDKTFIIKGFDNDDITNTKIHFTYQKTEIELNQWLNTFDQQFLI